MGFGHSANCYIDFPDQFRIARHGRFIRFEWTEHLMGPPTFMVNGVELDDERVPRCWWRAFERWIKARRRQLKRSEVSKRRLEVL